MGFRGIGRHCLSACHEWCLEEGGYIQPSCCLQGMNRLYKESKEGSRMRENKEESAGCWWWSTHPPSESYGDRSFRVGAPGTGCLLAFSVTPDHSARSCENVLSCWVYVYRPLHCLPRHVYPSPLLTTRSLRTCVSLCCILFTTTKCLKHMTQRFLLSVPGLSDALWPISWVSRGPPSQSSRRSPRFPTLHEPWTTTGQRRLLQEHWSV
jgi:hypothetical protein